MKFNTIILEKRKINDTNWIICKGKLWDYLDTLRPKFYDFIIQRKIVKNQYLDTLFNTVKKNEPIPFITLTYKERINTEKMNINSFTFEMDKIEILDGLQRSFRLWSYMKIYLEYERHPIDKILDFVRKIKEDNEIKLMFDSGVMSTTIIKNLISNTEMQTIKHLFSRFEIYFIVWSGLTDKEIIEKMLILNAGQKQVSNVHQYELLFMHIWNEIKPNSKIVIIKENDTRASSVKRGNREIGEFMFSSIIVSLMSYISKKPLRVSTQKLIKEEFEEETSSPLFEKVFTQTFMDEYLDNLMKIDEIIYEKENQLGKSWFVKDTTMSGIFSAVGKKIDINEYWTQDELKDFALEGFESLRKAILSKGLKLKEFEHEYDSFSSRNVNIGDFIRKVISKFTEELLNGNNPTWKEIFNKSQGEEL